MITLLVRLLVLIGKGLLALVAVLIHVGISQHLAAPIFEWLRGPGEKPSPTPGVFDLTGPRHDLRRGALALHQRGQALAVEVSGDARLARLAPVIDDELLPEVDALLVGIGEAADVRALEALNLELRRLSVLHAYLVEMTHQRRTKDLAFLGDADSMADACLGPVADLVRREGLADAGLVPVTLHGPWDLAVDLSFRDSAIAPIRLPEGFERSIWMWPALAHEVAHVVYFSVRGLEGEAHAFLGLPTRVFAPAAPPADLRPVFGGFLAELFADVVGALMMGPAYLETMARLFADPLDPTRTRTVGHEGGLLAAHPPERLRLRMCAHVLGRLGRGAEANALCARWDATHGAEGAGYYLPTGRGWYEVPPDAFEVPGREIVEALLHRAWTSLNGFQLTDVPGFAYGPAHHAQVKRLVPLLAQGKTARADARLVIAAAVLATAADESRKDAILRATRRSIVGAGTGERAHRSPVEPRAAEPRSERTLADALRDRDVFAEAMVLGAAMRRARTRRTG